MNLLYFGDFHERKDVPINRIDDYKQTVQNKVDEIFLIAKKHKVKALLQPGDFLNTHRETDEFLSEVAGRWRNIDGNELLKEIKNTNDMEKKFELMNQLDDYIPMVGAIGNHELIGNSLASYPKTSLSLLEKFGFINIPDKNKPYIIPMPNGKTVAITASHYHINMDKPEHQDDYIVDEKKGDVHIHLVHGYLTDKNMGNLFRHTLVDDIAKETKADLTLAGHDHIGFDLVEVDGKKFVNSGAIIRQKNDLKEMKRRPKVLLISIDEETNEVKVKNIYLKSAEKAEFVLDRTLVTQKQVKKSKIEEIKSLVNKTDLKSGETIKEIIKTISDNEKMPTKTRDTMIGLVTDKMNSLQDTKKVYEPYKITKVVLENFQSHKHSELELSPLLNVLKGESGHGKTAFLRALYWIYENKTEESDPRDNIHKKEEYAKATVYLDNGYIVSRVVERKKSGKNGYEVYDPTDGSFNYYNTKSHEMIKDLLGFTKLNIDTGKEIPLNFQMQADGWFYIGKQYTATERAKILGSVYQTHFVDAVMKDLDADTKRMSIQMKEKTALVERTEDSLSQYSHLPQVEENIQKIEKLKAELELKIQRKEKIDQMLQTMNKLEKDIQTVEHTLDSLKSLSEAQTKLHDVFRLNDRKEKLEEKKTRWNDLRIEASKSKKILDSLKDIEQARSILGMIHMKTIERDKKIEVMTRATKRMHEKENLHEAIEKTEKILLELKDVSHAQHKLVVLSELIKKKERVVDKFKELSTVTSQGKSLAKELSFAKEKITKYVEEYKLLLESEGTCPICKGTVNQEVIERIVENYTN